MSLILHRSRTSYRTRTREMLAVFLAISFALVARAEPAKPPDPAANAPAAKCAKREAFVESRASYQDMARNVHDGVWDWSLHPCGGTSMSPGSSRFDRIFRPCPEEPDWLCFGARRAADTWFVYFAMPAGFKGGELQWEHNETRFFSRVLVSPKGGKSEIVFIEAHAKPDATTPAHQRFIFSLENGLIAASASDKDENVTFAQVAVDGRGIFDAAYRDTLEADLRKQGEENGRR